MPDVSGVSPWTQLPANGDILGPDQFGASSSMNRFSHQAVTIAWDSYRIDSGKISGEGDSPDWQAAPA